MILQIDGWFAGGKSVLWSLLDGHKDVFANPIHDFSHALLLYHNDEEEWVKKKHTTHLRKLLTPTEYYKFEKIRLEKELGIFYSHNVVQKIKYDTDFYKFDKLFYTTLYNMDSWSIEKIMETLYQKYYEVYTNQSLEYPKYYTTMSHPGHYKQYYNIPTIYPNMKSIIVKRGLKNIIATRTNRQERIQDLNQHQAFNTPFDVILKRDEIYKILDFFKTNEDLQKNIQINF